MKLKETIIAGLNRLPYIKGLHRENANFKRNSCFPAGHFYSPIISVEEVRARESEIWGKTQKEGIEGIDLQTQNQIQFAKDLSIYYNEMPFEAAKKDGLRYYFANSFYSYTDGIVLYSIIRHFKPKRIIEIGSGFSSALMLDTNQVFFENQINLTFIEPYPERLYSLITEADKQSTTIIESSVQSVPLSVFQKLEAGDILFIDSTHVSKTGSDVNHILFEILPSLQSGVMIHFHDIFYPFEYPKEWVYGGKNWNEDYFLKAFLMYNQKFEIKLFSEYLHKLHPHAFSQMPLTSKNPGGNFWMQKK
jgi:predicted O-methyltransferase YrrM